MKAQPSLPIYCQHRCRPFVVVSHYIESRSYPTQYYHQEKRQNQNVDNIVSLHEHLQSIIIMTTFTVVNEEITDCSGRA
jgi:hypothetical protein